MGKIDRLSWYGKDPRLGTLQLKTWVCIVDHPDDVFARTVRAGNNKSNSKLYGDLQIQDNTPGESTVTFKSPQGQVSKSVPNDNKWYKAGFLDEDGKIRELFAIHCGDTNPRAFPRNPHARRRLPTL